MIRKTQFNTEHIAEFDGKKKVYSLKNINITDTTSQSNVI